MVVWFVVVVVVVGAAAVVIAVVVWSLCRPLCVRSARPFFFYLSLLRLFPRIKLFVRRDPKTRSNCARDYSSANNDYSERVKQGKNSVRVKLSQAGSTLPMIVAVLQRT